MTGSGKKTLAILWYAQAWRIRPLCLAILRNIASSHQVWKKLFVAVRLISLTADVSVNVADFIVFYSMPKLSYRAFRPFKILPGCRAFSHGSIQKNSRPVKKLSTHENKSRKININSQRVDLHIARCNDIWACYPKNWITKIILATSFWQRISFTKSEESFSDSECRNLGNAN